MSKSQFKAIYSKEKYKIHVELSLYKWHEEGVYYIYSPALDLTGYGKSFKEANDSFSVTLNEFVDYTDNKKTIFDELEHLGWLVNRKRKKVHAPDFEELLNENDMLKSIINKSGVKKIEKNIELALA
jgi:hypothetical protein